MSSTKEYRDFILEQLRDLPGITCRPMMGEYLLYLDGVLFGGIYDDRLLVKKFQKTNTIRWLKRFRTTALNRCILWKMSIMRRGLRRLLM